jgi:hypothetical protein
MLNEPSVGAGSTPQVQHRNFSADEPKGTTMKKWIVGLIVLSTIAIAQSLSYRLVINGKSYSSQAIVVRGETYVPLKALQAAGVRSSLAKGTLSLTLPNATQGAGGANQVQALEGCLNEWLFNGIWRIRATNPQPIAGDRNGWSVRLEVRNGTTFNGIAPSGTGWGGVQIALDNGDVVGAINVNDISDPPYIPGGSHSQVLEFYWEDTARTPKKLIVQFNPKEMNTSFNAKFTVPDPSLRFKTDCAK